MIISSLLTLEFKKSVYLSRALNRFEKLLLSRLFAEPMFVTWTLCWFLGLDTLLIDFEKIEGSLLVLNRSFSGSTLCMVNLDALCLMQICGASTYFKSSLLRFLKALSFSVICCCILPTMLSDS